MILVTAGWCALAAGPGWSADLTVTRHAFSRGVEGREPVAPAPAFPAAVGQLFFFTQIAGAQGPDEVSHVWVYDGREMARVPLRINGPTWRTWSSKQILPELRGDWTVEVRDAGGRVLLSSTCRIE